MVERIGTFDLLKGKILANLFYEPSTRTSSSFTAAMERLGGSVIPINEVRYSSVSKGEIPAGHRPHPGMLRRCDRAASPGSRFSRDGRPVCPQADHQCRRRRRRASHPGVARHLHDLEELGVGVVDGLTVTMLGDLKYGRTVHSLARLLSLYNVKLNYVSPDILRMPQEVMAEVAEMGIPQAEFDYPGRGAAANRCALRHPRAERTLCR